MFQAVTTNSKADHIKLDISTFKILSSAWLYVWSIVQINLKFLIGTSNNVIDTSVTSNRIKAFGGNSIPCILLPPRLS